MNRQQLIEYIQHPLCLNEQSLSDLQSIIDEYPFFQSARMIWIKNLHLLDHIKYNSELKLAAAHLSDREKLFFLINDYSLDTKTSKTEIPSLPEKQSTTSSCFDVDNSIEPATEHIIDSSEQKTNAPDRKQEQNTVFEPAVLPGADLLDYERSSDAYFDLSSLFITKVDEELHSFSSWLKSMRNNNTVPSSEKEEDPKQNKNRALIDNFLQKGDTKKIRIKIENIDSDNEDFSIKSLRENDDLMTETLANIYIGQKHFSKAINIFEQLGLKYPEKNAYFARRIREVEELIN